MSHDVFRQNKPSAACPSALAVNRFLAGDLDEAAASRMEEHLTSCASCRVYAEQERRQVEAARSSPLPSRLSEAIGPRRAWVPWSLAAACTAAAAVVLAMWIMPGTETLPDDGIRIKGRLALTATVVRDQAVIIEGRDLARIEELREGDRLRLRVSGAGHGQMVLSGCDASGCELLYRGRVPAGGEIPVGVRATPGDSRIEVTACPDGGQLDHALSTPKDPPDECQVRIYPILVTQNP